MTIVERVLRRKEIKEVLRGVPVANAAFTGAQHVLTPAAPLAEGRGEE